MVQLYFTAGQEETALVAFGSNDPPRGLGPDEMVRRGIADLGTEAVRVLRASSLYSTPCFPAGAGPDYANAAAVVATTLSPEALLAHLHDVEARHGRTRKVRWGRRSLDIDLLAYGDAVLPDAATFEAWLRLDPTEQLGCMPDRLIVPHPRLQDRAFVLVPLAEIAPEWEHPVLKKTVADMLRERPERELAEIRPWTPRRPGSWA